MSSVLAPLVYAAVGAPLVVFAVSAESLFPSHQMDDRAVLLIAVGLAGVAFLVLAFLRQIRLTPK